MRFVLLGLTVLMLSGCVIVPDHHGDHPRPPPPPPGYDHPPPPGYYH